MSARTQRYHGALNLVRRWLPELVALPLLPFLVAQGKSTRRRTPRLPEARGACSGITASTGQTPAISLLAIGESPVAGVGVTRHEEAITAQLAGELSRRYKCTTAWHAFGKNGSTVRDALQQLMPHIPAQPVDVALVAFGVNDTTAFRPVVRWQQDLRMLLQAVDARCSPGLILLSGVPPMAHFPALPQPLRHVIGMKARALDAAARELASSLPHVRYVPLALDPADKHVMAEDGYHPSATGCAAWASVLADHCLQHPLLRR